MLWLKNTFVFNALTGLIIDWLLDHQFSPERLAFVDRFTFAPSSPWANPS